MSLLDIKNYLMDVKIASMATLAAHFKCDSDVLRNMICHWMRKGCVRQFVRSSECAKTCGKCATPPVLEIYEWVV
ncbi:MAG TPA: FeoC-like transcriptional regulator [Gammaproteobacteria bacterium]|nr:FeoC-like transcriptional regulator [Gammaproteobacteria bacterium]